MEKTILMVITALLSGVVLVLNFRVFIPWLINLHNDGALILAVTLMIAVPTVVIVFIILVAMTKGPTK